jgi:hypothetical protein
MCVEETAFWSAFVWADTGRRVAADDDLPADETAFTYQHLCQQEANSGQQLTGRHPSATAKEDVTADATPCRCVSKGLPESVPGEWWGFGQALLYQRGLPTRVRQA